MFRILVHVLAAAAVGVLGFYLYGSVLPTRAATIVALLIAALELLSPIVSKTRGLSIRLMGKLALPLLAWPMIAVVLEHIFQIDWATGMALAAVGAVATGFLSAGHGSGRESLRLAGAAIATLIALYAMLTSIVTAAPNLALVASSIAVGEAVLVVYQVGVWPGRHERALLWSAGACGCAALVWVACGLMTLA